MNIYYTDGSTAPTNPGPGGYAVVLDGEPLILGTEPNRTHTTNIRMEGLAILDALIHANGAACEIHTDSQFWINVLTDWIEKWRASNWRNGKVKNLELVKELDIAYQNSNAKLVWVRGHNGDPGNELADHWANEARKKFLDLTA